MLEDTFANRLKKALDYNNMRPIDLANKTKISKTQISNYLKGTYKAKQDKLYLIAKALNVSEAWLMGFDVSMEREWFPTDDDGLPYEKDDNVDYVELSTKVVKIPILGKVPAGVPIEAIQEILGYEEIDADLIKHGERYFALYVKGNSMTPEYLPNDIIIIKQQQDCNSGDDCIVLVNGYDATLKRVIKEEDGIKLRPLNNDYETHKYTKEEILNKPVVIVGIVKELRRKK